MSSKGRGDTSLLLPLLPPGELEEGNQRSNQVMKAMKMGNLRPWAAHTYHMEGRNELTIVLVGMSGVGKSATGNTILGRKRFLSKASVKSVTKQCEKESANGVTVIDTPGLFPRRVSADEKFYEMSTFAAMSAGGLNAILLVLQTGRFTPEEAQAVKRIQGVFGEEAAKYTVVLFTRKEDLGDQTIQEFIEEAEESLKHLIKAFGGRFCAFNNMATGAEQERQVSELLGVIDRMVEWNRGTSFSGTPAVEILQKEYERSTRLEEQRDKELTALHQTYEQDIKRIQQSSSKHKEAEKHRCTEKYQAKWKIIIARYEESKGGAGQEGSADASFTIKAIIFGFFVGLAIGALFGIAGGYVGMWVGAVVGACFGVFAGGLLAKYHEAARNMWWKLIRGVLLGS
ncbi:GTPase IMAP family member 4-like [Ambystoma mexicanum]|uniref:GTPase IMAP family member 4-like n=1 Tax=Ambystoma mexicanum TaxID=8296 RepID=UPI0037E886D2